MEGQDGEKIVRCTCSNCGDEHRATCWECEGTGTTKTKEVKTGRTVRSKDAYVVFDDVAPFDPKYVELLLCVAEYEAVDEVACISNAVNDGAWRFAVGVAEVLVMPMVGLKYNAPVVHITQEKEKDNDKTK